MLHIKNNQAITDTCQRDGLKAVIDQSVSGSLLTLQQIDEPVCPSDSSFSILRTHNQACSASKSRTAPPNPAAILLDSLSLIDVDDGYHANNY